MHDNRPQHLKVDLPKELFLEGAWEVGVTERLYTHTFYESPRFTLTADDRTLPVSNGAHLDGGTHFITIAEEQYPGYYDVFEHVFDAVSASFEGVPVVEAGRGYFDGGIIEQFRWVLQPQTRMHLPLPLARKLGFLGLTVGEEPHKAESYFMVAPYNRRRDRDFQILNGRRFSLEILVSESDPVAIYLNAPPHELSDSDLMWEFTNLDVEDWIAVHFPRELYMDKSYRRLVFSMRDKLEEIGDKTGLGAGIDIVYIHDKFHIAMSPGASFRFSLPMAHILGFLDDNFALRSQYNDGRFQIQHDVQRMSLVWVEQPGLPLFFKMNPPPYLTVYNPRPFPRVESFFITSNLNIEPVFDGTKKSRSPREHLTFKKRSRTCTFSSWSNGGSNGLKLL